LNDPRDFISLTGFDTVGSILLSIGLLGCLLHRDSSRLLASTIVALTGGLLILDGAQIFNGAAPSFAVSLAVIFSGTAVAVSLRARRLSQPEADNSLPDSEMSLKNKENAAKTAS
jgi:hypothetical protein